MKKIKSICDKLFLGGYWIGKVGFPKIAPIMLVGMALVGFFQKGSFRDIPALYYTGLVILSIGIFGFFYGYTKKK